MILPIILCFVIGYAAIVFEHPLKLDKTVPAIMMGAICWALVSLGHMDVVGADHQVHELDDVLLHHIGKIAEILFFLIGRLCVFLNFHCAGVSSTVSYRHRSNRE